MLSIIRGQIVNKPITEKLVSFFENSTINEGNLFLGYPILPSMENKKSVDALYISKKYGIIAFIFYNETILADFEEEQDEVYNLLLSKVAKEKTLIKRGKLNINLDVVTLAPNFHCSVDKVICDEREFNDFFESYKGDNTEYYKNAMRCIQSIGSIKKVLAREKATTKGSRGWKLKELEKNVANLDKIQMSAAIEISDSVQRIRGLAGSGKTIVLALKAAYMHVTNPSLKIAITFNTRSLKQQFHDLITRFVFEQSESEPNWNNINIIHAWGNSSEEGIYYNFCKKNNIEYLDFKTAKERSSYETAFDYACETAMAQCKFFEPMYDVILVDEAQDFSSDFLKMCYEILPRDKRLIYAYDELQSLTAKLVKSPEEIFGLDNNGLPRVVLKNEPNKPRQDIILNVCYRNSRPVLSSAHALGFRIYGELIQMFDNPELWTDIGYEVESGQLKDDCNVVLKRSKECSPEFLENHSSIEDLIIFKSFDNQTKQAKWIAEQIKKNLEEDELDYKDIIVIHTNPLKTREAVGIVRHALLELNINSHLAGVTTSPDEFFQDKSITITSVFRAKGNEASMVYVMDGQNCGTNYSSLKSRNILFTAMTRSKAWVRVTGYGEAMESLCSEYKQIKDNDFKLRFVYPNKELRNKLTIINRDKSNEEQKRIDKINSDLNFVISSLQNKELYLEDIPAEILSKLKGILGKNED